MMSTKGSLIKIQTHVGVAQDLRAWASRRLHFIKVPFWYVFWRHGHLNWQLFPPQPLRILDSTEILDMDLRKSKSDSRKGIGACVTPGTPQPRPTWWITGTRRWTTAGGNGKWGKWGRVPDGGSILKTSLFSLFLDRHPLYPNTSNSD